MKASSHLLHLSIFGYWRAAVVTLKERAQVTFSVFKSEPTLGVDYFVRHLLTKEQINSQARI